MVADPVTVKPGSHRWLLGVARADLVMLLAHWYPDPDAEVEARAAFDEIRRRTEFYRGDRLQATLTVIDDYEKGRR